MPDPARQPAQVTVVEVAACHLCDQAKATLAELARDHPLVVEVVDAASAEGRVLVARHRPGLAPLVLLDGEFFSCGRLPRRRLERALTARGSRIEAVH
ncbi:glutaredoxin family protein [Cellulomonas persica]|uniref:Glutaredoxin n=1 Tax=Cellulomonas persica TaxID=76861 RepID=A0A510UP99_9CELL|nr:glutaredoxin family protein [Cellulomonas persica]GEK16487.1 hypothetical protein CPE01_02200 [Cellulomonas persica]